MKYQLINTLYKSFFKPLAFKLDPEFVHERMTVIGEVLGNMGSLVSLLSYRNTKLERELLGIKFANPIGLAAGFDYDGHMARVMRYVGFGFNTVGTVTARPYEGNPKPRLVRLPQSKSILVNKGFKSEGAVKIAQRLDNKNLDSHTVGVSVGSTNSPLVDTISKAINDYLFTLELFGRKKYIKYFEINISCPNTNMTESFTKKNNFSQLLKAIKALQLKQPLFIKMPSEIGNEKSDELVREALKQGVNGFIFSNLVKDRNNSWLVKEEIEKMKNHKGNFSGKPTRENGNGLLSHTRKIFGKDVVLVGCGGIFGIDDVVEKMASGADLVQLITGMIFEGPQLVGDLCYRLAKQIN